MRIRKYIGWKNGERVEKRWKSEKQRMEEIGTGQSVNLRSMWDKTQKVWKMPDIRTTYQ